MFACSLPRLDCLILAPSPTHIVLPSEPLSSSVIEVLVLQSKFPKNEERFAEFGWAKLFLMIISTNLQTVKPDPNTDGSLTCPSPNALVLEKQMVLN
jgi:hypothetical protein